MKIDNIDKLYPIQFISILIIVSIIVETIVYFRMIKPTKKVLAFAMILFGNIICFLLPKSLALSRSNWPFLPSAKDIWNFFGFGISLGYVLLTLVVYIPILIRYFPSKVDNKTKVFVLTKVITTIILMIIERVVCFNPLILLP